MGDLASMSLACIKAGVPSDLTMRQLALLHVVSSGRQQVRDLAKTLGVSKPVITRAVNSLAESRLVEREPDPADGRNVLIAIRPDGKWLLEQIREVAHG
ncbi:hypothetical protein BSL82_05875 [Tardibacter chloracetimidivorans]|uniref:HTH marR-type domain-containing protein n=1 Tax=Tardibacter chloracetimidivorans TaxID=1921510 RepID=A0A1L3ZTF0_9SPHN|nr:MarR family transcriptional regulator [Tardibacter chloracetimidivorans]API58898.1 hypothetical protein BSL82_05875 [Tardibacter chloracetimidivorans]